MAVDAIRERQVQKTKLSRFFMWSVECGLGLKVEG
jgi:hypothetical protein